MLSPQNTIESEEYQLDRQATAAKKRGDWDAAITALRKRKALLGDQWVDDKLAKYLQQAGRFEEAMLEMQWLLNHSQAWSRLTFGHQPVSVQQSQHAGHSARLHKAAALICKREAQFEVQAKHEHLADSYMSIRVRLEPIANAERKARMACQLETVESVRLRAPPQS